MIQMADPIETAELVAFCRTVEAQSLSRAAAELAVPRATISRRLARLEERLGARLLRRTTRSLALTDAGEALYRHARIVLDAVSHAEASVRTTDKVVRGDLRVSVPPMTQVSFHAMFSDFVERYPDVRLHVHASTHHVDLMRGGYDCAIRATTDLEPGLMAHMIARSVAIAVASPGYLAHAGVPRTRADLRKHRCLMGFARGETPQTQWPFAGGRIHVDGVFFSNDLELVRAMALSGRGIALLPRSIVVDHLARGELVHVLPNRVASEVRVAIVYPERAFVPPQVRAFVEVAARWARREIPSDPPAPATATARKGRARARSRPRKSR
jgi:DNA-binding transcriptional LysR family regulator